VTAPRSDVIREALAFQRSVIQSGEAWTETCAVMESEALVRLARLEAVVEAARSFTKYPDEYGDFGNLAAALRSLDEGESG
jgi:hypothetical protein